MYYSRLKTERIAREQKLHQNRKHQRTSLLHNPDTIEVVYPALTRRETIAVWLKAQTPALCPQTIASFATDTLR